MKAIFIVLITFIIQFNIQAQTYCEEDLVPSQRAGKMWGYTNLNGMWIIEPIYDQVFTFTGRVALVKRRGKFGAIDCNGNVVLTCDYDEVTPFLNGVAWYRKGDKWGLVGTNGKVLLQAYYDEVKEIARYTHVTWLRKGDKWGLYNKYQGRFVWRPQFDSYQQTLTGDYAFVTVGENIALIKTSHEQYMTEFVLKSVKQVTRRLYVVNDGEFEGVLDYDGKVIIPRIYKEVLLKKKLFFMKTDSATYKIARLTGNLATTKQYKAVNGDYNKGLLEVQGLNGKTGFLNIHGDEIIPTTFTDIEYHPENKCFIVRDDSAYLVNYDKTQRGLKYQDIQKSPAYDYFIFKDGKGYGFLGDLGKPLVDARFKSINATDHPEYVRVSTIESHPKITYFNTKSNQFATEQFFPKLGQIDDYKGFAVLEDDQGKVGLIDRTGKIQQSGKDEIQLDSLAGEMVFIISKNGAKQILNNDFQLILDRSYKQLLVRDAYIIADQGGVFNVFQSNGKGIVEGLKGDVKYINYNYFAWNKKGKGYVLMNKKWETAFDGQKFEDVKPAAVSTIPVKNNGKWGYMSVRSGKLVIGYQYSEVGGFVDDSDQVPSATVKKTDGQCVKLSLRGVEQEVVDCEGI